MASMRTWLGLPLLWGRPKCGVRSAECGMNGEKPTSPLREQRETSHMGISRRFRGGREEAIASVMAVAEAPDGRCLTRPELACLEPRLFLAATIVSGFADLETNQNQSAFSIGLGSHFDDPDIVGAMVNINTVMGVIPVELFDVANGLRTATPLTAANFLHHVKGDVLPGADPPYYSTYDNTIFHRSVSGFVIQGGGFEYPSFDQRPEGPTVVNEYSPTRSNLRGTVAMAKKGSDPNSATNQFFISLGDNSANLDSQNGGFTVFGRVVGSGMAVADAIAALPAYDGTGIDPAFDSLPLRNTPPAQAGPDNIVLINSIAVTSELTYSATTDIPSIVYVSVSGTALTLNFMPDQTGTGHVTVRATDVNGTYAETTFVITVKAAVGPPLVGSLLASPDPWRGTSVVNRGMQTLALLAANVLDTPGGVAPPGVTRVEFFRDSNGNGQFEPGIDQRLGEDANGSDGWSLTVQTDGWTAGPTQFFVRAQDADHNGSSPETATILIANIPPSLTHIYTMGTLLRNATGWISHTLLLNAQDPMYSYSNAWDANGDAISFRIEKVSSGTMTKNGAPVEEGVTLLGPGEVVTWTPAWNAVGTLDAFMVRAWDDAAASETPIQVKIVIDKPPVINSFSVGPKLLSMPGAPVTLVAVANDPDGDVAMVEFFYDWDGDGSFSESLDWWLGQDTNILGNWSLTLGSSTTQYFRVGQATFFARATDNNEGPSDAVAFTAFVNTPPTVASVTATGPVLRGAETTLTAVNVTDAGTGKVTGVQFFRDVNGDGKITAVDKSLGRGTLVNGTNNYTLTVSTAGFAAGENKIIARATDNNGGFGTTTGTLTVNNHPPTATSLKVATEPLSQPGGTLKLIAAAKDTDGAIAKVLFYYDSDANGTLDTGLDLKLGEVVKAVGPWTLITTNTGTFTVGDARYFAVAVDNDGASSAAVAATGHVNTPPTVESLTTTGPVLRGGKITLTATNVQDVGQGNSVKKVEFFLDLNGNDAVDPTDKRLGTGALVQGTNNYALTVTTTGLAAGDNQFIARATDNNGGWGIAVAAGTISNNVPTLGSLTRSPALVTRGAPVVLTANLAADVDGKVAKVEFYVDLAPLGEFDPGVDLKIGEDTYGLNGYALAYAVPPAAALGTMRFYARAVDNDGGAGNAVTASTTLANANPTIGSLAVAPNPVTQPADLTLTANNVANPDGDGLINRVRFYEDINKNKAVDAADQLLGEDTDDSDGWSITFPSSLVAKAGNVRFLVVAEDNDGGSSATKYADSQVSPPAGIDLVGTALAYAPKAFNLHTSGQTLTVTSTIRNRGAQAAGALVVEVLIRNQDTGTDYSVGSFTITGLASLADKNVRYVLQVDAMPVPPPAGTYYVVVRVDADHQVTEFNELNNDFVSPLADVVITA